MIGHEFYIGVSTDHLYRDCPSLQRSVRYYATRYPGWPIGHRGTGTVDPLGTDVCGLCSHRLKRKHPWLIARDSVPNNDGRTAAEIVRDGRDE